MTVVYRVKRVNSNNCVIEKFDWDTKSWGKCDIYGDIATSEKNIVVFSGIEG